MQIRRLRLQQFRNAQSADYQFQEGLIFITGANGSGKTTILEAIGLLSFLKSFRNGLDRDLIAFGASYYRVSAEFETHGTRHKIGIAYGRTEPSAALAKVYDLDGARREKSANIIGKIATVVLSPDDLKIVAGEHQDRRKFFDLQLSLVFPLYYQSLQRYQKALQQRSTLLRQSRTAGVEHEPLWLAIDKELANAGFEILMRRREFFPFFETEFSRNLSKISREKDTWKIVYHGETRHVQSAADYLLMLQNARKNDLKLRQTTTGIHRDRVFFCQNGELQREIKLIASQGQKRSAVLAMKMAQYEHFVQKQTLKPILLIDDVLNELDLSRREGFIDFMRSAGQVFFTTTDLEGLKGYLGQLSAQMPVQEIRLENS